MKTAFIAAAVVLAATTTVQADDKKFDGAFLGAEGGYLDAGDGINGLYYGVNGGFRKQTDSGLVYGLEGTFGKTDVDFAGFDNIIDHQWSAMGTIGWVAGAEGKGLLSLGAGVAQVKASAAGQSATGEGIAGFAGYEHAIGENLSFRVRVTTYEFDSFIGTAGFGFRF